MKELIYQKCIELTNGKVSSFLLQKATCSSFSKKFIRNFSKIYKINQQELSKDISSFTSLHDFFIRELKENARPIDSREQIIVSPTDGKIESFGDIVQEMKFTVKNKLYSLVDLLGNEKSAQKYKDGKYMVIYLSPANYHRVHSPASCKVIRQYILGRKSYPVNSSGLKYGKKPISHNYRMVHELQNSNGRNFSLIKVGAMFVNSIRLTNVSCDWKKGEEIGYFSFGSTVVLLFEKDTIKFGSHIKCGQSIKMGEAIAIMI